MHTKNLISVSEFCSSHQVEVTFVRSLSQTGLIEIKTVNETAFIDVSELKTLEKILRFYYDLDINIEGIETVTHLLMKIELMQAEIVELKNKLRLYESE